MFEIDEEICVPTSELEVEEKDELLELTKDEEQLAEAFEHPDVAFVFGNGEKKKVYTKKEKLRKVSPVFEAMFSSGFKETKSEEVPLPGKKMSTFIYFLRLVLPEHVDQLTETTAHEVLPLVREYQTEELRRRIDQFLSQCASKDEDQISSTNLITKIIEAEEYCLGVYLNTCIGIASKRKYNNLVAKPNYENINKETQLKIANKRWEDLDTRIFTQLCNDYVSLYDWKYSFLNANPRGTSSSERCKEFLKELKEHVDGFAK